MRHGQAPSSVFHLPSSIFPPFLPASAGKPAGALIVSVGSGLARSRLALATGGRSYSIRRFGGPQIIEQLLFPPNACALPYRIDEQPGWKWRYSRMPTWICDGEDN